MGKIHKHIVPGNEVMVVIESEEKQGYWLDPERSDMSPCICCGMSVLVFTPQV